MTTPEARPHRQQAALGQALPLATWLLTLVGAIVLFTAMGSGSLAAPPVTDPGGWGQWASDREPVVATVAMLRLLVLALAWYLVGATTVGAVARLARSAPLVRLADALSVPMVRRVLQASLGLGLTTAVIASTAPGVVAVHQGDARSSAPAAAGVDDPRVPSMRPVDTDRPDPPSMSGQIETPTMQPLTDSGSPAPPGMRPLEPAGPSPNTSQPTGTPRATPADAPADPHAEPDVVESERDVWTVRSGEHLWSIAETHLGEFLGVAPTDEQVVGYWHRLIEANRDRLVDRDNPDLILPGQEFVLPDVEVGC